MMDDTQGRLVLANEDLRSMASGFVEGINIEAAQADFTADQHYSDYIILWMSRDAYSNTREDIDGSTDGNGRVVKKDSSQPGQGFRPHIIISEQVDQSNTFAERRATGQKTSPHCASLPSMCSGPHARISPSDVNESDPDGPTSSRDPYLAKCDSPEGWIAPP